MLPREARSGVCSGPSAGVRPVAEPLCPDADVLLPEADALLPSEDPPRCSGTGCFRGGVGFIGWLGKRRLRESYPAAAGVGAFNRPNRGTTGGYRSAPLSI